MENNNLEQDVSKKHRTTIYLIMVVALIVVSVTIATFAYFASTRDINTEVPVNVATAGATSTFTASSTGEIEFGITAIEMAEANVSENYLKTDNAVVTVKVASASDTETTTCTYDLAWIWDDGSDIYDTPSVTLPYTKDSKTYPFEFSVKVTGDDTIAEKDISNLSKKSGQIMIAEGLTITAPNTQLVTKNSNVEVQVYNIPVDQTALFNKKFKAHIQVVNHNCVSSGGGSAFVVKGLDITKEYDGTPQAFSLDVTADEPYTAYYSTNPITESNYKTEPTSTTTAPTLTNAGTQTIYWCVECNSSVSCGSNDIIISKKTPTFSIAFDDTNLTVGGSNTISYTYNGDGNVICDSTGSYGTCTVNPANKTITFTRSINGTQEYNIYAQESANYASSSTTKVTVVYYERPTPTITLSGGGDGCGWDVSTYVRLWNGSSSVINYTYNGDGEISCLPATNEYATCTVDPINKKITINHNSASYSSSKVQYKIVATETDNYNMAEAIFYVQFNGSTCFDGDTEVDYYDKKRKKKLKKKIRDIHEGDLVYAYDESEDKLILKKVKNVIKTKTNEICHIFTQEDEIISSIGHPFYVKNLGLTKAKSLKPGYELACGDGKYIVINRIEVEKLEYQNEMYCLELEDDVTFAVGKSGVICQAVLVAAIAYEMTRPTTVIATIC